MRGGDLIDQIVAALWLFVSRPQTWDSSVKIAIVTAVATVTWSVARGLIKFARFYFSSRLLTHEIELTALVAAVRNEPAFTQIEMQLYCLLIRFGTDLYIEHLASDQEKYEGRLQNQLIAIRHAVGRHHLDLPVHMRLGTQFKLFVQASSSEEAETYARLPVFQERNASTDGEKVWFFLKAFGRTKTIEGFENNFVTPTRLAEFVDRRRNRNLALTLFIKRVFGAIRRKWRRQI